MNQNELLEILASGFKRFYSEGHSKWSKALVQAAIQPAGVVRSLDEPEVQAVLKELEKMGLIRLLYKDECYLEVLRD